MSSRSPLVQRQLFNDWCCINSRKEVVKKINKMFMIDDTAKSYSCTKSFSQNLRFNFKHNCK